MVLGMTNYGYAVNADDGFSFAGYTDEQLVKTYNELKRSSTLYQRMGRKTRCL